MRGKEKEKDKTRLLNAILTYLVIFAVTRFIEILTPKPEVTSSIGKLLSDSCSAINRNRHLACPCWTILILVPILGGYC